jgi:threonine aldolase
MQVDLRSDTVTRPTEAMRRAMLAAPVGDVCHGDDPTVARLEAVAAERLGKEAALFVPSGSMSNQIGVAVQTRPGDAVLVEGRAHIAAWEGAGAAASSGVQLCPVVAEDGLPTVAQLAAARFPAYPKAPRLRLLALEDTHNAAGGLAHPAAALAERAAWARAEGLRVHLDGARLFNAAVATGDSAAALSAAVDTVNLCLSKGLGAPIGSILAADRATIAEADRVRHRLGGGWRQAGILAAAGLHALAHHVDRLADDHARARAIAEALAATGIARPAHPVMTNLVCYEVDPAWGTAAELTRALADKDVLVFDTGPTSGRLVTHLDLDDAGVARVLTALTELC